MGCKPLDEATKKLLQGKFSDDWPDADPDDKYFTEDWKDQMIQDQGLDDEEQIQDSNQED